MAKVRGKELFSVHWTERGHNTTPTTVHPRTIATRQRDVNLRSSSPTPRGGATSSSYQPTRRRQSTWKQEHSEEESSEDERKGRVIAFWKPCCSAADLVFTWVVSSLNPSPISSVFQRENSRPVWHQLSHTCTAEKCSEGAHHVMDHLQCLNAKQPWKSKVSHRGRTRFQQRMNVMIYRLQPKCMCNWYVYISSCCNWKYKLNVPMNFSTLALLYIFNDYSAACLE